MTEGSATWEGAQALIERIAAVERPHAVLPSIARATGPAAPADTDEVLMLRYQRGSEPAFRTLYERHRSPLLRFVRRLSPDPADSEEIVQETWMAVIKARERFVPQARFVTYLYSIARRRTVDRWRRRGPMPDADTEALDALMGPAQFEPAHHAQNAALGVDLRAAIDALPYLQREAFLLRAEGGLSLEEIAEVTGANRETAKSRLRFAMSRLRGALEDWHDR